MIATAAAPERFFPASDMIASGWVFFALALIEAAVLHLLLLGLGHSPVLLALVGFGDALVLGMLALMITLPRHPTTFVGDFVVVRVGFLFRLGFLAGDVDLDGPPRAGARMLNGAMLASPNLVLMFRSPVQAKVLGLWRFPVDGIRLKLDRPEAFLAAVRGED